MVSFDKKIIIAIDGYSSCGKSSFAKQIASLLGYIFIDTGAMYRAITYFIIKEASALGGDKINEGRVTQLLEQINITFKFNSERGASDVYVNGQNVEAQCRSIEVSNLVSKISQIPAVREKLVAMQQAMGDKKGIVMDGRDIGTVVFPSAELKIFMTASAKVRALRRYKELIAKGDDVSMEQIEKNIMDRDFADENRAVSPLRKAKDAIVLDNSAMSVDDQMVWFKQLLSTL